MLSRNSLKTRLTSRSNWYLILIAFVCAGLSCTGDPEADTKEVNRTPILANITEPVERDYADIKNTGILRVITSYSSSTYFCIAGYKQVSSTN